MRSSSPLPGLGVGDRVLPHFSIPSGPSSSFPGQVLRPSFIELRAWGDVCYSRTAPPELAGSIANEVLPHFSIPSGPSSSFPGQVLRPSFIELRAWGDVCYSRTAPPELAGSIANEF